MCLHNTEPAGNRGIPVTKEEKDICTGIARVHWQSFKVDLKRERNKTRITREKSEDDMPVFKG